MGRRRSSQEPQELGEQGSARFWFISRAPGQRRPRFALIPRMPAGWGEAHGTLPGSASPGDTAGPWHGDGSMQTPAGPAEVDLVTYKTTSTISPLSKTNTNETAPCTDLGLLQVPATSLTPLLPLVIPPMPQNDSHTLPSPKIRVIHPMTENHSAPSAASPTLAPARDSPL